MAIEIMDFVVILEVEMMLNSVCSILEPNILIPVADNQQQCSVRLMMQHY